MDSILIVYPQERFARQAFERFRSCGISFEVIEPPGHLSDIACPVVKVSGSLFGEVHGLSKANGLFHIGIVDWRPAGGDAGHVDRVDLGNGQVFLDTVQITFIAACMADETELRFIDQFDRDISEVLPYLNAILKGAVFIPDIPSLGFPMGYRMPSSLPRRKCPNAGGPGEFVPGAGG